MRAGLSVGVIVALVIAVWVAVASGDEEPTPTTVETTPTTATTLPSTTTSTAPPTTTATTSEPTTSATETTVDEAARVEEVRLILEDLYFRWFDAIYRNDEEAVREIVATQNNIEDFHNAVANLELPRPPERSEIAVRDVEILREDPSCLVVFSVLDASAWRGEDATAEGVNVLLPVDGEWRFGTAWKNKGDLWQQDCEIEPDLRSS